MTVGPSYQICPDCDGMCNTVLNPIMDGQGNETEYTCERCVQWQGVVPDTRLQDIADAWKSSLYGENTGKKRLSDLLDALTGVDDG